jgi:ElaB/YqjD/DUF883 family membrane-anchored ribosome-binding protein
METYFANMTADEGTTAKLVQDLLTLVHDAEDLVRGTGENLTSKSKEELLASLEKVKRTCRQLEETAVVSARSADRLIREYPYPSMGAAFGIGLLIGVLINRR